MPMTQLAYLHWGAILQTISLSKAAFRTAGNASPAVAEAITTGPTATSTVKPQRGHARTSGRTSSGRASTSRGSGGNG